MERMEVLGKGDVNPAPLSSPWGLLCRGWMTRDMQRECRSLPKLRVEKQGMSSITSGAPEGFWGGLLSPLDINPSWDWSWTGGFIYRGGNAADEANPSPSSRGCDGV